MKAVYIVYRYQMVFLNDLIPIKAYSCTFDDVTVPITVRNDNGILQCIANKVNLIFLVGFGIMFELISEPFYISVAARLDFRLEQITETSANISRIVSQFLFLQSALFPIEICFAMSQFVYASVLLFNYGYAQLKYERKQNALIQQYTQKLAYEN